MQVGLCNLSSAQIEQTGLCVLDSIRIEQVGLLISSNIRLSRWGYSLSAVNKLSRWGYARKLRDDYKEGWPEPCIYGIYMVFLAGKSRNMWS